MFRAAAAVVCASVLALSPVARAADAAPLVPVTFAIEGLRPGAAMLTVVLFRPTSPDWGKRFKRAERADLRCQQPTTGARPQEDVVCELEPGAYIALAFVDTDRNGTLTHGLLGPIEQFGVSGVGHPIQLLPPEAAETVIDTRKAGRFSILLN
jgi:uncharacterized protein (DUF2141 family)